MSILVDELVNVCRPGNTNYKRVGDIQYVAKPSDFYGFSTIVNRVKDACRILTGKSHAYHYWEDER